jgi:hypothetical protein
MTHDEYENDVKEMTRMQVAKDGSKRRKTTAAVQKQLPVTTDIAAEGTSRFSHCQYVAVITPNSYFLYFSLTLYFHADVRLSDSNDDIDHPMPPPLPQPDSMESTRTASRTKNTRAMVSAKSVAAIRKRLSLELEEPRNNGGEISIAQMNTGREKRGKRKTSQTVASLMTLSSNLMPQEKFEKACLYCNELTRNEQPREKWLQCRKCMHWAHNECAGISSSLTEFVCELCQ